MNRFKSLLLFAILNFLFAAWLFYAKLELDKPANFSETKIPASIFYGFIFLYLLFGIGLIAFIKKQKVKLTKFLLLIIYLIPFVISLYISLDSLINNFSFSVIQYEKWCEIHPCRNYYFWIVTHSLVTILLPFIFTLFLWIGWIINLPVLIWV